MFIYKDFLENAFKDIVGYKQYSIETHLTDRENSYILVNLEQSCYIAPSLEMTKLSDRCNELSVVSNPVQNKWNSGNTMKHKNKDKYVLEAQ